MDQEQDLIRKVGEQIFGKLANELPEREFDVLLDLWRKYKADMDHDQHAERKQTTGDLTGEQAA